MILSIARWSSNLAPSRRRTAESEDASSQPSASPSRPQNQSPSPRKRQKPNADVGLADIGPEVIATRAEQAAGDLQDIQSGRRAQSGEYRITETDRNTGHHVAALRYVCRVAEDKTILLFPGAYKLEGRYEPNEYSSDDIVEWSGEGWCSGKIVEWKPNKGSLVIEAEGITLRCSDPTNAASIIFETDDLADDDPHVNWALIGKVDNFTLDGINTKGGLSINCRGLSAKRCVLGGTVHVNSTASFEDCTVRDGKYGGMSSSGNLQ
mmetsp:Transcript_13409/g.38271  ORF Transcript_13409/g.38271 Transcript_13409/m.38271 type:complete len:265 (-) Transcript_13409:410-1204(-)